MQQFRRKAYAYTQTINPIRQWKFARALGGEPTPLRAHTHTHMHGRKRSANKKKKQEKRYKKSHQSLKVICCISHDNRPACWRLFGRLASRPIDRLFTLHAGAAAAAAAEVRSLCQIAATKGS